MTNDKDSAAKLSTRDPSALLITQRMAPEGGPGVWTVISAASDHYLKSGAEALMRTPKRDQVVGGAAVFRYVDNTVTSAITPRQFVQLRSFSFSNIHLVVAGWFSNNHLVYGLLFVVGLFGFALVSNRLLGAVGADPGLGRGNDNA